MRLKLVDELGYFDDALRAARALAGTPHARVVTYERRAIGRSQPTVYSKATFPQGNLLLNRPAGGGDLNLLKLGGFDTSGLNGPVLQYLWMPGRS